MKKLIRISLLFVALLMAFAMPGHASGNWHGGGGHGHAAWHGGGHGGHGGVHFHGGVGVGFYYPFYSYYPYNYYPYPYSVVVIPETQTYAPQSATPGYLYYCRESGAYYPTVTQCPGEWMRVVPSPPQ
ncbi:hypothetical protein [Geobacter sp. SVR]|uniref:hypothetical protein n=1 Tax=Geobacter sp. SVR TaxID=2495594 RepID=UPI00143EFA75|nr:hypothetical protein [Geobacter sp. SVR]BCS52512.1 hypothetical protein GSVR_08200 [Geobacter sp. SVR]GCF84051.1 hypothetical protein GSbR_06510 [Geobacter sp. SVR]